MYEGLLRKLRGAGLLVAAALVVSAAQLPSVAFADTAPVDPTDPKTPVTVAADALPTTQIDGVAWSQVVVGNTVYVGGNFTTARPAGSAAGVNTVTRSNLLAYDIRTGVLNTTWAPAANGEVLSVTASPDGTRIYVGGSFTTINGSIRNRIAALDATSGALVGAFQPKSDAKVRAIVATADTVYFGGLTTAVNGVARNRAAAARASDGALLSWAPAAAGGSVNALALSPDKTKVLIGGSFTSMNGSDAPGYGLAAVDTATGGSLPWAANAKVRNGGGSAAITSLTSDGTDVYASGYVFGAGGNLEGAARMTWGGDLTWVEDCHGDTYSTYPAADALYVASHAHYCGNLPDGFGQTDPWTFHFATAYSKATTGTLTADPLGYANWAGTPSPSLLKWMPMLTTGKATGQNQAGWTVTGNSQYVVYGGEFPRAGSSAQQGLVRYAVKSIAPNKVGPEITGSKFNPNVTSLNAGTARISWTANWDRDNENLTYQVFRNGILTTPIYETKQNSSEWSRPAMGFVDTGLTPGTTYRYRVFAKDAFGNEARSDTVSVTVSASSDTSGYSQAVIDDGANAYYRLGEDSGTTVYNYAGFEDATAGAGVTRGADGAISGTTDKASTFNGSDSGTVVNATAKPAVDVFTTEAWIKTTTTSGGKIIGYGGSASGNSGSYDRQVYMGNDGRLTFGVYTGNTQTVTSPTAYNDGQWHHVVASMSSAGMVLSVDGRKVAGRTDTTSGQVYNGYWRVGGDNLGGWPNQPSSYYFNGTIDDVAIYPTALSSAKIRAHYIASGRTLTGATAPTDAYGKAVYTSEPDLYWRLGETSGTTAADSSPNGLSGTYNGGTTQGGVSGVGATDDKSVALDGSTGAVASNATFSNPSTYSEELWFNTTTTRGGKLIGFGTNQFGSSGGYDRHVYMFNDGRLRFGTYTGQLNVIDSAASFNDGKWHHMVATQGADGMKLYVDNSLVGTNAQTGAQDYSGYWRVGGDNTWGGADSNYFAGSIDEVAIYSKVLSATDVQDHFTKGGGQLPNVAPTAAFDSSVAKLKVTFDGSGSSDSDGTVASYAWDFGDGTTGTGAKPSHTYAAAGDYAVKLTVTDDDGTTGAVTKTVTAVANGTPTAAFSSEVAKLKVTFDGSGSSDSDGTVASYAWDFGDGTTGTGAKPNHTYAAAGDYAVKLTVTDDDATTGTVTKTVTAIANAKPAAGFTSDVSFLKVTFDGSGSTDSDGMVASYAWDFGDGATSTDAKPSHTYAAAGAYSVKLTVTDDDGATDSVTKSVTAVDAPVNQKPTAAFTADVTNLKVAFDGSGSTDSDGTVASYAWTFGDGTTSAVAKPSKTYAAAGAYTVKLTVTDDAGATDSVTKTVTALAPTGPLAVDAFGRTSTNGWGTADTGGDWTRSGTASLFAVANGAGTMKLATTGSGPRMTLGSVSSTDSDVTVKVALDKIAGGGNSYVSVGARAIGTNDYRAKVKVGTNGALTLYIVKVVANAETTLKSVNLPSSMNYTAGTQLNIRIQAVGTTPTNLKTKVWKQGTTEPTAWTLETTDSTAELQAAGGVSLVSYLATTGTNAPIVVSFDDLQVKASAN